VEYTSHRVTAALLSSVGLTSHVGLGHGLRSCLISRSAKAAAIGWPVAASIKSHWPVGLISRKTYSPSGVSLISMAPYTRPSRSIRERSPASTPAGSVHGSIFTSLMWMRKSTL
jgi:hypothetical protein